MNAIADSGSGSTDDGRLATLVERFRQAPSGTTAERAARGQLLDDLQDVVGLSGKMTTEAEILRRAEKMLRQP